MESTGWNVDKLPDMSVNYRKLCLKALKVAIAVVLLGWIVSGVSLRGYVLVSGGDEKLLVNNIEINESGDFTLALYNGREIVMPPAGLLPVDPAGGLEADNYLRPGLLDVLRRISLRPLMFGLLLLGVSYLVGAWRWHALVKAADMDISASSAIRLTWVGLLFNNVILGTTGGDLAKAYYFSRAGHSRMASLLSVMADRIFGLVSLVLVAVVSLLVMLALLGRDGISEDFYGRLLPAGLVILAAFLGVVCMSVLLVRMFEGRRTPGFLLAIIEKFSLGGALERAVGVIKLYRRARFIIPASVARSTLMQLLFIFSIWQFSCAIRLDIPLSRFILFVPLIYMIAAVPLTPGAVGVLEGLYAGFFAAWAGRGEMLILALLVRLAILLWSLPGLAAMMGRHLSRREIDDINAFQ